MRDKKKWLVHIIISFALFRLGFFFLDFVSQMLFSVSSVLDVVITIPLLVVLALFAWFFGGWLTKKLFGV